MLEGVEYSNIDLLKDIREREYQLTEDQRKWTALPGTEGMGDEMMRSIYLSLLTEESALLGYRRFLEEFLTLPRGSLIFHCFAGKGRTGLGAAMILTLLGASDEDIIEDYMLTNILRREVNEKMLDAFRAEGRDEAFLRGAHIGLYVERAYIEFAFRVCREMAGSFHNFTLEALHVTPEERERMLQLYTR